MSIATNKGMERVGSMPRKVAKGAEKPKGCGHRWVLQIEAERPKACPQCAAKVSVSDSDATEYAWFYWGEPAPGDHPSLNFQN